MPEVPVCIHCGAPIDEEAEQFVIPNKAMARHESEWVYAHLECEKARKPR